MALNRRSIPLHKRMSFCKRYLMCTLALYFQESVKYPLIVAANRDEYYSRPSAAPKLLEHNPAVVAGQDLLAGGTWLGVNEHGLLVGILNRRTETKRDPDAFRSRGLLCLDLLRSRDFSEARSRLSREKGSGYQPFNLLVAGAHEAFVASNLEEKISLVTLEKGLHVLSNASIYETKSEKLERAYGLFSEARKSATSDLSAWLPSLKSALRDHSLGNNSQDDPKAAICVHTRDYGTVSSTVIFYDRPEKCFYLSHAPGPPCRADYREPVRLSVL